MSRDEVGVGPVHDDAHALRLPEVGDRSSDDVEPEGGNPDADPPELEPADRIRRRGRRTMTTVVVVAVAVLLVVVLVVAFRRSERK